MKYRAEIDGLRAVAVIPVILFHAGIETFAGGFVGVDVFFVISGFLITNILIEDIENNNFSLINFYERRCRRIIPALFFMILVCMPFAWAWMLPSQMKDFSASVISVATFLSNFHFTFKGDYFGISVEEMPLLHTWSLAVEEQFYIVFPIFLFLFWRFGKRNVLLVVIGLALASLALSQLATIYTAGRLNFFFTPSRVWELLAGTIAAFIVQKQGVKSNNLLSVVGLLAIATAIAVYDEKTPFPSAYTLLPVVGTAMFLVFADAKTMGAKILGFKAFVGIGLISYSAYLWHQPLFAFARIRLSFEPSIQLMLFLSLLSLVLGYLSW